MKNVMSNFQRLVKYVIWVKIGPIHLQGIKIYPCQLDIIGAVSSEEKNLGQNSKIEIDNSNNNHTTTGSLSSSLHDAEELLLRQYNYLCGLAYEVLAIFSNHISQYVEPDLNKKSCSSPKTTTG